ncbi:MAG TPA: SRPBCC family protein [Pelagibacterium sp.]|uniref:SRPBCC family protein n=1 Tax=Pelagibacterium sp. TaxID=1967288 RepID=UPI002CD68AF7|nr:SRPBCC family protein [Pelagibacterium sp.]HWJ89165.1 SRPBCC family protein [Pelagibacterium sp.]
MPYEFTVSGRIARSVHDVFEAVADPAMLSKYFTTGGAKGRLETGATVTWDFHDFPGAFPVHVVESAPDTKIVLRWDAAPDADGAEPYQTTVTITFEALNDGRTLVRIHEAGFHETEAGLKASYGNCEGWTGMLCALRVWIEHGINLRDGFYK